MRRVEIDGYCVFLTERRPRFFSEGCALGDNGETVVEEEPAVGPLTRRDRSRSEPAIQRELHRAFGRELRRISDEFHQSYQTLVSYKSAFILWCHFSEKMVELWL